MDDYDAPEVEAQWFAERRASLVGGTIRLHLGHCARAAVAGKAWLQVRRSALPKKPTPRATARWPRLPPHLLKRLPYNRSGYGRALYPSEKQGNFAITDDNVDATAADLGQDERRDEREPSLARSRVGARCGGSRQTSGNVQFHPPSQGERTMSRFTLPTVGSLEFPADTDGYWQFDVELAGRTVEVDFNVDDGQMTNALLEKVKAFLVEAARFDSVARQAIHSDYNDDADGAARLYLSHHADAFSDDEKLKYFGAKDLASLGAEPLLKAIHLNRIGLYPDSEDYVAVFDYTLDEEATHYILAVEFDESGEVTGISMDS